MTIIASNSLTLSNVNDGTITHTAYSWSADGKDRFTTTYPRFNLLSGTAKFDNFNPNSSNNLVSTITKTKISGITNTVIDVKTSGNAFAVGYYLPNAYNITAGQTITISFIAKSLNDTKVLVGFENYPNGQRTFTIAPNWTLYTHTFTATTSGTPNFMIYGWDMVAGQGYQAYNPKAEEGSFATLYMSSSSEVTTADWPKYRGEYSDMSSEQSTNPSDYTWSLIRGDDGKDGATGKDGAAGKDGVGIKTTVITYAISTSGTTAPNSAWTSSVPSLVKGQYLWTKTVWTYSDTTSETGYSVSYISKDGNNGNDGIAGKDGTGIKTTTITYAGSTSGTTAPANGWTSAVPTVAAGSYLWTKTVWAYTDNTSETGYSVAMMGLKGDKGDPGNNGTNGIAGKDGKGIKATAITYQASTNGTTAPTGTWSASVPTVAKGSFLWTRTIWTYTDNATETGYAVAYMGTNGNNGNDGIAGKDGVGIKTTTITYAGSTSGTTAPTSGWTSTVPTVAAGNYLWTKTVWAYTDNSIETGYSVGKMGNTGPAGPAGSDGNPGKIVSDTEPTTKFVGLTWKYSGITAVDAYDGTNIQPNTEYYWNGKNWVIYLINAQNIDVEKLTALTANLGDATAGSLTVEKGATGGIAVKDGLVKSWDISKMTDPNYPDGYSYTSMGVALDSGGLTFYSAGYGHTLDKGGVIDSQYKVASLQAIASNGRNSIGTGLVLNATNSNFPFTINGNIDVIGGIRQTSKTASVTIGAGLILSLERRGDMVEATLSGSINSPLSSNTNFTVGTIPVGYRPNSTAYIMVHMTSSVNSSHIDVGTNGVCTWWGTSTNTGAPRGHQMWFTNDSLPN